MESGKRNVDVLIAGGGLAGRLLACELHRRGLRIAVADDPSRPGAWSAAVGLLNPVRGPRFTVPWGARLAFEIASAVYAGMVPPEGRPTLIRKLPIFRTFSDAVERERGLGRIPAIKQAGFDVRFEPATPPGMIDHGLGGLWIEGGFAVEPRATMAALADWGRSHVLLLRKRVVPEQLQIRSGRILWPEASVEAGRVVFAGGAGDIGNPFVPSDWLTAVKGESIVVTAPSLHVDAAVVGKHHLVPRVDGTWICGGTNRAGETNTELSEEARVELEAFLGDHFEQPAIVVEQCAGVRSVSRDRLPIVGPLLESPGRFILNGLGSQGVAYGPWMAQLLAQHLDDGSPLPPEITPARFRPRAAAPGRWHAVDLAHELATPHLQPGGRAIDLTAGNGGDTCWLAERVGPTGRVTTIDIQPGAIEATRKRLSQAGLTSRVNLVCADHAELKKWIPAEWTGSVAAVMANLGYLPGSTSPITTQAETTRRAIEQALLFLSESGVAVIVAYPGHDAGVEELAEMERWTRGLDPETWVVTWHREPAGNARAPVVLELKRVVD